MSKQVGWQAFAPLFCETVLYSWYYFVLKSLMDTAEAIWAWVFWWEGFNYEFNFFSVRVRYLGFLFNFVSVLATAFKEFVNVVKFRLDHQFIFLCPLSCVYESP